MIASVLRRSSADRTTSSWPGLNSSRPNTFLSVARTRAWLIDGVFTLVRLARFDAGTPQQLQWPCPASALEFADDEHQQHDDQDDGDGADPDPCLENAADHFTTGRG